VPDAPDRFDHDRNSNAHGLPKVLVITVLKSMTDRAVKLVVVFQALADPTRHSMLERPSDTVLPC
jgi:hypothetical protein